MSLDLPAASVARRARVIGGHLLAEARVIWLRRHLLAEARVIDIIDGVPNFSLAKVHMLRGCFKSFGKHCHSGFFRCFFGKIPESLGLKKGFRYFAPLQPE